MKRDDTGRAGEQLRSSLAYLATTIAAGAAGMIYAMPPATAENLPCASNGCAFLSPSGHISCEVNYHYYDLPDSAYCQWVDRGTGYSVTLHPNGLFESCFQADCVGNPGQNTPTLGYGQTAAVGPFTCLSATSGVTCTAAPSGRGFTISSEGISPVG